MRGTNLLLVALLAGCATPATPNQPVKPGIQPDGSAIIVVPPHLVKACQSEGGCTIYSNARIEQVQQEAFAAGAEAGAEVACKKKPVRLL